MYPIAQVREPYTVVGYLAARVPLVQLLRLQHPDPDTESRTEAVSLLQPKTDRAHGVAGAQVRDAAVSSSNVPLDQLSAWKLESGVEKMETDGGERGRGTGQLWTPWDLCDGRFPCESLQEEHAIEDSSLLIVCFFAAAWAEKRGYYTSRAARFDSYRAGTLPYGLECVCVCVRARACVCGMWPN